MTRMGAAAATGAGLRFRRRKRPRRNPLDKKQKKPRNKAEEWLAGVGVGSRVDARDVSTSNDVWYSAKVTNATGNKLKIHFQGFAQRFDKWIDRDLAYLQPHGTKAVGGANQWNNQLMGRRSSASHPRESAQLNGEQPPKKARRQPPPGSTLGGLASHQARLSSIPLTPAPSNEHTATQWAPSGTLGAVVWHAEAPRWVQVRD